MGDGCVSCTRFLTSSSRTETTNQGLCPHILRIRGILLLQSAGCCKRHIFSVYQLLCSLLCRHTALTLLTAYLGHTAHCTSCSGRFNLNISSPEVFCIASRLYHVVTKKKQHLCQDSRSLPSLWRQRRRHSLLLHRRALFPCLAKKKRSIACVNERRMMRLPGWAAQPRQFGQVNTHDEHCLMCTDGRMQAQRRPSERSRRA